jgi:hypothetical protein
LHFTSGDHIMTFDIWSIPNESPLADTRDILVLNGMFNDYGEKRLTATRSTKQECTRYISRMKKESPDTKYIIEGENGCYFISQVWYDPIPGSNLDGAWSERDDIEECAKMIGMVPV